MNVWIFLWLNLKNIENKMDSFEFEKYIADAEYIDQELGGLVLSVHFQACFYLWNGHTPQSPAEPKESSRDANVNTPKAKYFLKLNQ